LEHEIRVHKHHFHTGDGKKTEDGSPIDHGAFYRLNEQRITDPSSPILAQIADQIRSTEEALASGDPTAAIVRSKIALGNSKSIGHHGLKLDSYIVMGEALTQAGREKEALQTLDQAGLSSRGAGRAPFSIHRSHQEVGATSFRCGGT